MEMGLVQTMEAATVGRGRGRPEGPGYAEYLLVVYPHGDLQDRLMEEQQRFSSDYGLDHRLDQGQRIVRNKPHITLAVFQAGEEVEDTLSRWIQRICQQHRSFELALNNYSGIPPHTICLRVQDPEPLRELMRHMGAIDEFVRSSGWPPVRLIGRPDYSRRTFHGIFRVGELVLLRRRHSFDPCKTVNVFGLKS
jgi:hypothetical protein